ncbi:MULTISPECIES: carboxymuconolactone decarboxylase family protein [Brevibacillus]|uniref:carboxymuconolactone decarboxylase family protein n=1 Tax=Brevibacillus TaxID=55080 RepID=UPI001C8E797E|nr:MULTISPECIES: carboxymuconolactone decarboxylase family protein [Brevibacillus]MBY0088963.1 carboxymuconolactone decarboxylase family protein [Brevibacillus brevis]MCE0453166.1 carboxymuconolactone decarboxylase family protein [Brevibacillus sp. AF8]MCM3146089.1 carboxymuconolactone decarboxylase family protein [Brevibacillus sp. MER 51]UKK96926.1 carboxymuconolactone decarboxylase family protein [Brevibacillus brevis]
MQARINHRTVNPEAYQTMLKLEKFVNESGLDKKLIEMIKIRASQINGCAFCMDMHTQDARKLGETEQRIYLLSVWRESAVYTEAERAVLALTEAVTVITANGVSEELYQQVREHFDENQYVALIMAINTINSWNRIAISTGMSAPYNK